MEVLLQGRAVNVHVPEELPPVELDYVQIGQVMTNLLENAVRSTTAFSRGVNDSG